MADEISFGYTSGRTLTYGAYQPDGTVRTAAGTALAEVGTTGYYKATDASIVAGDRVVVKDSVAGVVGFGEYLPTVTATGVDLTDIEDKIDLLAIAVAALEASSGMSTIVYHETIPGGTGGLPVIVL